MQADREMLLGELLATMSDRGDLDHTPSEDELSLRLEELSDDELQKLYSMGRFVRTLDAVGPFAHTEEDNRAENLDSNHPKTNVQLPGNIGKYVDLELVGVGGFANVYRAFDSELKRFVALKIPHSHRIESFESRERFRREAQAIAGLNSDAIVSLHEADLSEDQTLIALEWIDGQNFQKWLSSNRQLVDATSSAKAIKRLAEGLSAAHSFGVLHRDIKPANVLVPKAGQWFETLKLTDFGLARHIKQDASLQLTGTESILGTPSYMSPEQARSDNEIGPASDIYSLGAVLYELLTGVPPHKKDNFASTLLAVENEPAKDVRTVRSEVPRDIAAICMKALEFEPTARYRSANEFAEDLGRFIDNRTVKARPVGMLGKLKRWAKRNSTVAILGGLATLSVLVGVITTFWYSNLLAGEQKQLQEARIAEEIQRDLKEQSLQSVEQAVRLADPVRGREEQLTAVKLLRVAKRDIEGKFLIDPEVRVHLLSKIAQGFVSASMYSDAIECRTEALKILDENYGPLDPQSMTQLRLLAQAQLLAGQLKESLESNRELLLRSKTAVEKNDQLNEKAKQSLAKVQIELGKYDEVIRSLAYPDEESRNFDEHRRNLLLIKAFRESGLVKEALVLAKAFWQFHEKESGPNSFAACRAKAEYIIALSDAGKRKKAIPLANELVADWSESAGLSSKFGMKWSILNGWLHFNVGDLDEAEAIADRAIEAGEERYGKSHGEIIRLKMLKSRCHAQRGDRETAIAILAEAIEDRRDESSEPIEHELQLARDLSRQCRHNEQPERSLAFLQLYSSVLENIDPLENESVSRLRREYFRSLAANGRPEDAIELCRQHMRSVEGRSKVMYGNTRLYLVHLLIHAEKMDEAMAEAISFCEEININPQTFAGRLRVKANSQLAILLVEKREFQKALEIARQMDSDKATHQSYGKLMRAMEAVSLANLSLQSGNDFSESLKALDVEVSGLVAAFPKSELHVRLLVLRAVSQRLLLEQRGGNPEATETVTLIKKLKEQLHDRLE